MDTWNLLLGGFATAATPINLLWAFVGCALGTAIGVLPGLGPAATIALLLPATYAIESPVTAWAGRLFVPQRNGGLVVVGSADAAAG